MKNLIQQFSVAIISLVVFTLIMSYTRPAAEEPKQYIVVHASIGPDRNTEKFEAEINQKLAEGWHLQGGFTGQPYFGQAMVK